MPYYLTTCAIFRDEAPYLREWLEFHLLAGVEHFYLYNNFSADDFRDVLEPYIRRSLVTLTDWPVHIGQTQAYDHCLKAARNAARWIAFIDIDEFLFSPLQDDLKPVLKEFEQYSAVVANWVNFGSSGHERQPDGLVIANYTRRGPLDVLVPFQPLDKRGQPSGPMIHKPFNQTIKSIVDPTRTRSARNPHCFNYSRGGAVDENYTPVSRAETSGVSVNRLRVNHYFSKSQQECRAKFARGRADAQVSRKWEEFLLSDQCLNSETDEAILRFVEPLEKALGRAR